MYALNQHTIGNPINAEEIIEIGIYHIKHDSHLLLIEIQDKRCIHIKGMLCLEMEEEQEIKNSISFEKT
jgi:hypothetical protein